MKGEKEVSKLLERLEHTIPGGSVWRKDTQNVDTPASMGGFENNFGIYAKFTADSVGD